MGWKVDIWDDLARSYDGYSNITYVWQGNSWRFYNPDKFDLVPKESYKKELAEAKKKEIENLEKEKENLDKRIKELKNS